MSLVVYVPTFRGLVDYWLAVSWLGGQLLALHTIATIKIPVDKGHILAGGSVRSGEAEALPVEGGTASGFVRCVADCCGSEGEAGSRHGTWLCLCAYWCCVTDSELTERMKGLL